jgi:citrate lyase synthetase
MNKTKVDILGVTYLIRKDTENNNPNLIGTSGYTELYIKEIVIEPATEGANVRYNSLISESNDKVLRHELVHAFLYESGLLNYCQDETIVDWIAIQMPKMVKAMIDTKCLKEPRGAI